MIIKNFLNGNFHVKKEEGDGSLLYELLNSGNLDFDIKGEEYCLGNAIGMAQDLYNHNTQKTYMVAPCHRQAWEQGKTVYLVGVKEDKSCMQ